MRPRRLIGAVIAALALAPAAASGAVISPTTTADGDGVAGCTLREAIIATNLDQAHQGCPAGTGTDVISLAPGATYTLNVAPTGTTLNPATGSLDVNDPTASSNGLTIAALGRNSIIDAGGIAAGDRVLSAGSPLTITNVTVTGGEANDALAVNPGLGGGVLVLGSGRLVTEGSLITGNSATSEGGGIHAIGTLNISRSTISGNSTNSTAGGGGGGISSVSGATISQTTIASNTADSGDNLATGGGLKFDGGLTLSGSILGDNTSDGLGPDCGGSGSVTSGGFNVIETSCNIQIAPVASDRVGSDPALSPLDANGGPTRTQAIGGSSPALDIGPSGAGCSGTDQRGLFRGVPETGPCDAGAYERAVCGGSLVNVLGSARDDAIAPSTVPAVVFGQAGADTITGTGGADALCGNSEDDRLIGRAGPDRLIGGGGVDIADYSTAASPLTVTLNHAADDGVAGEGDNADVDSIVGGRFNDRLTGDGLANGMLGGGGSDILNGAAGDDSLRGGEGNDSVTGSVGNDVLDGGAGTDTVLGQDGADFMNGGPESDTLNGGTGDDTLRGGAGNDRFACGTGKDVVHAGPGDIVGNDCETVIR